MKLDYRYFFMLAFLLQGCATLQENQTASRIAIQYATGKVINENEERAQRVVDIATQVRALANDDPQATVTLLIEAAESLISWDNLDPADTRLARQLLNEVGRELRSRIGDDVIPDDARVTVILVADWVIEAAEWQIE